jgi:hypothetical protein
MKESRSNRLSFVDTQEASSSGISEHLTMSSFPPAIVHGGLVVPLYLIVVSIIGATVSIARAGNKALAVRRGVGYKIELRLSGVGYASRSNEDECYSAHLIEHAHRGASCF